MEKQRFSDEMLQEFYDEFKEHAIEEKRWRDAIMNGFPGGDAEAHRKYHEAVMRAAEAQEKFWAELRLEVAKKGVITMFVVICGLVVAGIAAKLGMPIKP